MEAGVQETLDLTELMIQIYSININSLKSSDCPIDYFVDLADNISISRMLTAKIFLND